MIPFVGETALMLGGPLASYFGQKEANQTNQEIADKNNNASQANAREQMKFQERMSNSAYQRAAKDLKKAGLNPLIALGNAASTPSGASAVAQTTPVQNELEGIQNSAFQGAQMMLQAKKQTADIGLINEQSKTARSQDALNKASAVKALTDAEVARKGIPEAEARNMLWNGVKKIGESVNNSAKQLNNINFRSSDMGKRVSEEWKLRQQQPIPMGRQK